MALDKDLKIAAALAVTAAGVVSTHMVDLGAPTVKRRVGTGTPLGILVKVTTAAAGDGSSLTDTFRFQAISSAASNGSNPTVLAEIQPPATDLVVGAHFVIPIPPGTPKQQYLGAFFDAGADDTVAVDAYVAPIAAIQQYLAHADAVVR